MAPTNSSRVPDWTAARADSHASGRLSSRALRLTAGPNQLTYTGPIRSTNWSCVGFKNRRSSSTNVGQCSNSLKGASKGKLYLHLKTDSNLSLSKPSRLRCASNYLVFITTYQRTLHNCYAQMLNFHAIELCLGISRDI